MQLPVLYDSLGPKEKKRVREEYIARQGGLCMFCNSPLSDQPPSSITDKPIRWIAFPKNFTVYPVHLQHDHSTGLTEGAVHMYCNAVLWQYHGR